MGKKAIKTLLPSFFIYFLLIIFSGNNLIAAAHSWKFNKSTIKREELTNESWMGVYVKGIKVGYVHSQEFSFQQNGKKFNKNTSESDMKISRLGGRPIEVKSTIEVLSDEIGNPLESIIRTKMSDSETTIKIEVLPGKIVFKTGEKLIKEVPCSEKFYFEVPVGNIIEEESLKQGAKYSFKILDPLLQSLADCSFEIIGREDILVLGRKMSLWHVKEDTTSIIPVTMNGWIDDNGKCWKSESKTGFITITSIRMTRENALKMSEENFDIAFSTIIKSNIILDNPQDVRKMTFKLSGISLEKIKEFPFDDQSQRILKLKDDYALVQTSSQIFKKEQALPFPVRDEDFQEFLKPTTFCQSDDIDIKKRAKIIVGEEKNSWSAAKKIADWVNSKMTPNYDVGFATAKEILKNMKGDCSEHTVLTVALCRAVGIPARAAVGIMYAQGIFAYHMWSEVYVGRWINLDAKWLAVDKKSGEYYTDATHIKFGRTALGENLFSEMARAISEIIGKLKLEITEYYQDS
ncbi:MAG: transglutaminase-like domain-containing protein [Acidobacteriota bacterium]|nr:transglutaminase-like domain-containing protein [Acidobacteriota bacterium]